MRTLTKLGLGCLLALVSACATLDPRNLDVDLPGSLPEVNVTSYTQALGDLGFMTEIYDTPVLKLQSQPIGDNTGTSASTGGEIPRDITEIMKSSLNAMGGRIVFIPYDPAFMQSQLVTGYSTFSNKEIPDVVLSGGITEFDRGLELRGQNADASLEGDFSGMPPGLPSQGGDLRYGQSEKSGLAKITLDCNLLNFASMTGIPKMTTTNTMAVRKVMSDRELGISLFGQSFGAKGSVKKVQGRHAAVRLLVELSIIQILGKHLMLPYWRLLGEGALADQVVLDGVTNYYSYLTPSETNRMVQEWLTLYGQNVKINGVLDAQTKKALHQICEGFDPQQAQIDAATFVQVYIHIPLTGQAKARRAQLNQPL